MSFDYIDTFENWDDPFASDGPCPWGGIGNYVVLDSTCDWECPYRTACMEIKKRAKLEKQGDIWRRLFQTEEGEK